MLSARATMCLLAQRFLECLGYSIENGHRRQAVSRADFLQSRPCLLVHECVKNEARIGIEFRDNTVEVLSAPDHGPEMAHHIGIIELRQRRLRQHFQRFAGTVGKQVEMDAIGNNCLSMRVWTALG